MHSQDIVDIMFYMDKTKNTNRLFSLGADKRIIEYDIPNRYSPRLQLVQDQFSIKLHTLRP